MGDAYPDFTKHPFASNGLYRFDASDLAILVWDQKFETRPVVPGRSTTVTYSFTDPVSPDT